MNCSPRLLKRVRDAERAGRPFMTTEHAVHRLTVEVAEWLGIPAGTLREGERPDFAVIDPAHLDGSVDAYGDTIIGGQFLRAAKPHPQRVKMPV